MTTADLGSRWSNPRELRIGQILKKLDVCDEALKWAGDVGHLRPAEAWQHCPRGDWMVWFAVRVSKDRWRLINTMNCMFEELLGFLSGIVQERATVVHKLLEGWVGKKEIDRQALHTAVMELHFVRHLPPEPLSGLDVVPTPKASLDLGELSAYAAEAFCYLGDLVFCEDHDRLRLGQDVTGALRCASLARALSVRMIRHKWEVIHQLGGPETAPFRKLGSHDGPLAYFEAEQEYAKVVTKLMEQSADKSAVQLEYFGLQIRKVTQGIYSNPNDPDLLEALALYAHSMRFYSSWRELEADMHKTLAEIP